MVISRTGKIADRFWVIGPPGVPIFLLDGEKPAVFDGGVACLANVYLDQINSILGERPLSFCFITHSHFDHLGAVSRLKRAFPDMEVCANPRIGELLKRPNAVGLMKMLSAATKDELLGKEVSDEEIPEFEPFELDRSLSDGETIPLGNGASVKAIETPGHTKDSVSYYIPERRILIASEALGIPESNGHIYTDFLVGYDVYLDSVKKLGKLDIDTICFGHSYVFTGKDAREYIPRVVASAEQFFDLTRRLLEEEGGDLERVKNRIKAVEYDTNPRPKQPEPAYLLNLEARITSVKRKIEAG